MSDEMTGREARLDRKRRAVMREILDASWAYLAECGASALSLRGIASSLGMSAPAIYRYFENRERLVTALVLDAFESLAVSQEEVAAGCSLLPWRDAVIALGRAFRTWALSKPEAFLLVFGNPVPGYRYPWDETMATAGRSLLPLVHALSAGRTAGDIRFPLEPPLDGALKAAFVSWSTLLGGVEPEILCLAFSASTRLQGFLVAELGGQLPPLFGGGGDLYERELAGILSSF